MTEKENIGLMPHYEKLLMPYKGKKLLEVGVLYGDFLEWASQYFEVLGVDNTIERIKTKLPVIKCDQNDKEGLKAIGEKYGKFDVVIDDGSHQVVPTMTTFKSLWPYVNKGGVYIIEDWLVGYWGMSEYRGMEQLIADIMVARNFYDIKNINIVLEEPNCSYACFYK